MASEILGLFTTPEQYQQNQLAQARSRAFQEVQLDPFQQAALGARTAGYQFGQAVGGALGGQDPQLQRITQRQQLLGMIDPSNPDTYAQAIEAALRGGDQEAAFLLRNEMMKVRQQAQEQQLGQYKTEDYLSQRDITTQARTRQTTANQLFGQLKNADGTINEQVKNQLLSFQEGRDLISAQAKVIPDLRRLGAVGAVEDDPFKIFIDDATIPESVKISARQYSDSFKKGTIDPEKVDGIVTKLAESTQRVQQFEQNQAQIKSNQALMDSYKQQGLQNSQAYLAIAQSNNSLAQQNAAFQRQMQTEKFNIAKEEAAQKKLKAEDGKEIKIADSTKLSDQSVKVDKLVDISQTFKPNYAGYPTDAAGNIAVWAASKSSDPNDVALFQWWQNYQEHVNTVRNDLFGAALTAPEKAEFEKAMVTKGMSSTQAQTNLRRQADAALKAYDKLDKTLRSQGYSKTGLDILKPTGFQEVTPLPIDVPAGVTVKRKGG